MNPHHKHQRVLRLLFWESTIKCNLTCAHCRRIDSDEDIVSDLSGNEARMMIDQLVEVGKEQGHMPILVFSGGEPLCRDDIFELISYANGKGLDVALATNGTLLDSEVVEKIKGSGVSRVSVSLDGATAEIHNKLRKLPGSFEAAVAGIGFLKRAGVEFQINVTMTRHNKHQLGEIFVLAKEIGAAAVHLFMLVPVGCGEEFTPEDMLSSEQYEQMLVEVAKIEKQGQMPLKVTCGPHYERVKRQEGIVPERPSKGCLAGLAVAFVSHQGDVFPCGYLPVNCGNILQTPLKRIWAESSDLARMRNTDLLKGKCSLCGYKKVCGGCRARAFAASGNYMGEEPFCDYQPDKD